jgi:SEC-C motif
MEVSLFPNLRRPGFGLKPKRESQRPLLPQHARHCPVLEAGSGLGFMVHPPLAEHELYQVGYEGEGRYQLTYSINPEGSRWEPIFTVNFILPIGGIGATSEEVKMLVDATPESNSTARLMARMFIVPEDLGTPAGAVTLRGAWNFQTPPGWDTVYTPIFNMIERPIAPMMVIRVETDWYVHDTEFRYVLQPGETVSASHSLPIGQVLFVPREEITLREGTEVEASARLQTSEAFFQEKSASKIKTPYGLEYSPHYLRTSRQRNAGNARPESPSPAKTPLPESTEKPGRNDPCPCGSGRKYKRCHGENA